MAQGLDAGFIFASRFVSIHDSSVDKWVTSRGLRKFRHYLFSQWLPYNRVYGGPDDVRFWKWQVYHSLPGSSYTNNPTEYFNC
ncbi:hypothetical protein H257_01998 [Aphanomyces astaci]|uniref:Uncharacterized protein n=1 Tax=Aphanomyces astaci TaxID=112090 RepID=W4H4N8_APHAT|nr:hypothetical protein H257_01998 [Aphanomyces astaci]ETV86980.1 hypothetical protein H257_01998 [Aphanomyces astaci]|eukprot:XP_009823779.1 hypothetical protein H257_01998 [Aphanomyces astaci]